MFRNKDLVEKVQMLNAVRRLQAGLTIPSEFLASLVKMSAAPLEFLLQVRRARIHTHTRTRRHTRRHTHTRCPPRRWSSYSR